MIRNLLLLSLFLSGVCHQIASAQDTKLAEETERLLARLDLTATGLQAVRVAATPAAAATALLTYYRGRSSVKHPVDPASRIAALGNVATPTDFQRADDALRHFFVGQPSYPPHFCGDDIDWSQSPVPDKEWVWQLNRMYFWDSMAKVYWHTGEEKYARAWCAQVVDWIRKNPRDADHAYAWRSIEAGIRGHSWTHLFQRFLHADAFTPDVLVFFLNSCFDHAEYLSTKYTRKSNWGLMEAEGMAFIGMTFPEFKRSNAWVTEAIDRLNQEIHLQVYDDGHQRELAFGYHMGCIDWFMRTYHMAGRNGKQNLFSKEYTEVVEKMAEVPMKLAFPNGVTPQFGDSWAGKPGQYYARLREWATYFNRPDFLYVASEGKEGKRPEATAFALKTSGLYSMRSDWNKEAICLVLKCGPDGGGHSQPDNGTFELYAGGRQLMPDAGSYIYSGDPVNRAWFRQTAVHQTLTLDSANTRYAPELKLWQPGEDLDILVVENKGYEQLTHRRSVFFVDKQYFVMVDDAIGEAAGNVDIHFQLAPGEAVFDKEQFAVRTTFTEGWNVLIKSNPASGIELTREEGQVSFLYTKKEPRPAFRYRKVKATSTPSVRFVTVVAPYQGEIPTVAAKLVGDLGSATQELMLDVAFNGKTKRIGYRLPAK
jgi:heparan-sulfate lyase